MRNEKELNPIVDAHARAQRASERVRSNGRLQDVAHISEPSTDTPFPRLEAVLASAIKNPYAAIAAMIAVASLIVTAIVGVAASMFAAVFIMYGTMNQTTAKLDTVIKQLDENKTEAKVMRTYTASTLSRQNFMVGLMTRDQQRAVAEYDKNNPVNPPKEKE